MKSAEWGRDGERTRADLIDGMALRAMNAYECQTSLRGRRLRESGGGMHQQRKAQDKSNPDELVS